MATRMGGGGGSSSDAEGGARGDGGGGGGGNTGGPGSGGRTTGIGGAPMPRVDAGLPDVPPASSYVYPVKYSPNKRYLVDQRGVPFPIMGRTAWGLVSIQASDADLFLDDTLARGYNAIETMIPSAHNQTNNVPRNGNGDLPFLKRLDGSNWTGAITYTNAAAEAPDFTSRNEVYWTFVDRLLSACESRGIVVFLFPAYVGIDAGQGWMDEMAANGASRLQDFGAFVANRYKDKKNLVWMMGGDRSGFASNEAPPENALLTGLKSVAAQQSTLFSAEWAGDTNGIEQSPYGASMTLNSAYSWYSVIGASRRAYMQQTSMPAFLLEEPYDEEGPDGNNLASTFATQPVRRYQWWGWLSAIGGYVSGNGYVWPFKSGWKDHLNTQNTRDMTRLNVFMQSYPWYTLLPSGLGGAKTLITAGGGTYDRSTRDPWNDDYVGAAVTPDGALMVIYAPPKHTGSFTVDMTAMSGSTTARWFDPTTAAYTVVAGSPFANSGTHAFTPPVTVHADGYTDWVLVLTSP